MKKMKKMKRRKKIVVADDDPAILDALKLMLEEAGYEVETTENGVVEQHIKKSQPDLLLLDVWMSGTNGRDVCMHIKNTPETKHIPVIMMSAAKDIEQIAKDAGADGFITKPFEMDHLLSVAAKHITKR